MRMKAEARYPLDEREIALLIDGVLKTDAILLGAGMVLAVLVAGLSTGDWTETVVQFGWAARLSASFAPHPAMVALPAVFLGASLAVHGIAWPRSTRYRSIVVRIRQGVSGEVPRIPLARLAPVLVLAAFAEELFFRYGAYGLLATWFMTVAPAPVWAQAAALAISSFAFMLIHAQYEDAWTRASVFTLALALGVTFIATGSLLACTVAHALYNLGDVVIERRRMVAEDDYFQGKVPTRAMEALVEEALRRARKK